MGCVLTHQVKALQERVRQLQKKMNRDDLQVMNAKARKQKQQLSRQLQSIRKQTKKSAEDSKKESRQLEGQIAKWKLQINGQMNKTLRTKAICEMKNLGAEVLKSYRMVCYQCLRRFQKFTLLQPSLLLCGTCNGKGLSLINHKYQYSKECDKCQGQWYGLCELIICQKCYGRGAIPQ